MIFSQMKNIVAVLFVVCQVSESEATSESNTDQTPTTTTRVPRFKCGRGRCRINLDYCDKEDSTDPDYWTCHPCIEIPVKWCKQDPTRVPRDCYGYCKAREYAALLKEKVDGGHHLNDTQTEEEFTHGGIDAFLIRIRYLTGILSLLAMVWVISILVVICVRCRRQRRPTNTPHGGVCEMNLLGNERIVPPGQWYNKRLPMGQ